MRNVEIYTRRITALSQLHRIWAVYNFRICMIRYVRLVSQGKKICIRSCIGRDITDARPIFISSDSFLKGSYIFLDCITASYHESLVEFNLTSAACWLPRCFWDLGWKQLEIYTSLQWPSNESVHFIFQPWLAKVRGGLGRRGTVLEQYSLVDDVAWWRACNDVSCGCVSDTHLAAVVMTGIQSA